MSWLCRLGLHRYVIMYRYPWWEWQPDSYMWPLAPLIDHRCRHCYKHKPC